MNANFLPREEYVEQAYLFRTVSERLPENMPLQELLAQARAELLATTKLPMAVDFMLSELLHGGAFAPAMDRLKHYFAPFQAFLIREAESERGRFDFRMAMVILQREAEYRASEPSPQGLFLYQFESLCRNRLSYDRGLAAMAGDSVYDEAWRDWILEVRRQVGLIDLADMIYVRSEHFWARQARRMDEPAEPTRPILFGDKEGKIALANRRKDPLYFFAALQRHLNYPSVPRPQPIDESKHLLPQALRRLERLETRIKLLEEEQRGGIDITKFYNPHGPFPLDT